MDKIRKGLTSRGSLVFTVVAGVLAIAAFAWACTPSSHGFSANPDAGLPGTAISGTGVCMPNICIATSNREFYQDVQLSAGAKAVDDHQTSCTTGDTDIGSSTYNSSNYAVSASGTVASGTPGPHIVCAGVEPALLWDNFTLL